MLYIITLGVASFLIGAVAGVFIMWPFRVKYRTCRIERLNSEALLSQMKPRRDATGKFVKAPL